MASYCGLKLLVASTILFSSFTYTPEQTQRYAATFYDPARLATAFAGVVSQNDGTNNLIIRGNSPNTTTWWLEGAEIVNPNHYIATVSTSNIIEIEFKFEYGTGYRLATQNFSEEFNNYLQLDTVFMPVQKVDFKIENVYDTSNNSNERLFLDIWTNGSISPNEALKSAAQFTMDLFSFLVKRKDTEKNTKFTEYSLN